MSYQTWHNYGYGICVDDIREHSAARLEELLKLAPELQAKMRAWLTAKGISAPAREDYMEYDTDYNLGLAVILREAIHEIEGIELTACDDFECNRYLIYQPSYPWNLSDTERNLTEDGMTELFQRYTGILTDETISIDHQSVENGG